MITENHKLTTDEYKALINATSDLVFVVDTEGTFLYFHADDEQKLSMPPDLFIGRTMHQVWPEEVADFHFGYLQKALKTKKLITYEFRMPVQNGNTLDFEARLTKAGSNKVVYLIRDISQRKDAERLLEKTNKELQKYAYVLAHDFMAPLKSMQGLINLMLMDKKLMEGDKEHYIDMLSQLNQRLQDLATNLLEEARTTKAKKITTVDCEKLLKEVLQDIDARIKEVKAVIKTAPLPVIKADKTGLKQIFQNLICNSCRYAKENTPPEINIQAVDKGEYWHFIFKDNGIGIKKEEQKQVLEPYYRSEDKTVQQREGTGIGLSRCKEVVEKHGGSIWIESEPMQGTTVNFTIKQSITA